MKGEGFISSPPHDDEVIITQMRMKMKMVTDNSACSNNKREQACVRPLVCDPTTSTPSLTTQRL